MLKHIYYFNLSTCRIRHRIRHRIKYRHFQERCWSRMQKRSGSSAFENQGVGERTTSYVRHTISYVTLRCRRFDINRIKYTISYITYDIVCQQTVPTTSYAICTYDIVYDMNLQTYDVVCFLGHTISYTTCIFWDIRYRTSYLRCRM